MKNLSSVVTMVLLLLVFGTAAQAQTRPDTLTLVLDYPECEEGLVGKVACGQLADLFISELKAFYQPVLGGEDRKQRLVLYGRVRNQNMVDDTLVGIRNPLPAQFSLLKLSEGSVSVKLVDFWSERTEVSINLKRKFKDPRKDIQRLANKAIAAIIWEKEGVRMGPPINLRIRTPKRQAFTFEDAGPPDGRRRTEILQLSGTENYASLPAVVDGEPVLVIPTDPLRYPTFADWMVRQTNGKYRLRPRRLRLGGSAGLTFQDGEPSGVANLYAAFELVPHFFVRSGAHYFILPVSTTVSPFGGPPALARTYRDDRVIPFAGLGYELRNSRTGVIFSLAAEAFPNPRFFRLSTHAALNRLPWLRLEIAWQSLQTDVETRTFSSSGAAAAESLVPRTYNFPSVGLGLNFTL